VETGQRYRRFPMQMLWLEVQFPAEPT